ncbi:MAG: carboxylating nicotinate-nucleotide diphosphorylase [Candidatus Odinarchaeum yellowstonii]|uniref:Nicotinate-nucleotide pyrophosphorylase [carboxylating] n=1 Tax=Odinarchaeota yellowstonii (strain LCB_4) TaxID=1841599 RepID=A0AAF0D1N3_ODILC|nr:MAG: carboxylating nicotinate-nucleotide diphosphorylase [Candidatus Odinarchaeum yellowstonii]
MPENLQWIKQKVLTAFLEDVGYGDLTTEALIPESEIGEADLIAEERGVLAGLQEAKLLFNEFNVNLDAKLKDGEQIIEPGLRIASIKGPLKAILTCERTALNFLMRMSGVATLTHRIVLKAKKVNPKIRVAATRKTIPLLGYFDKRAVQLGGGDTHRLRLDDCILIKDNHIAAVGGVEEALRRVRKQVSFTKKIEIEVENEDDAVKAAKNGADIIMLDNMKPASIISTIRKLEEHKLRDKILLEASGGINEENIEEYAKTGVDVVSLGYITHSAKALNFKIELETLKESFKL